MELKTAIATRKSVRAFKPEPVSADIIREILELARRAPSGGNLQPWLVHVLAGEAREELTNRVIAKVRANIEEEPGYPNYPVNITDPYRTRRRVVGQQLYDLIGVARDDRPGKLRQLEENYRFFGAPVAIMVTFDRQMELAQISDIGGFMAHIMLLARDYGLHTCPQAIWVQWEPTVRDVLNLPDNERLLCGIAIGYADDDAIINTLDSDRAPVEDFATFRGF